MPDLLASLERFIAPLKRRLSLAIVRALLDTTDDSNDVQILQVVPGNDELLEGVEVLHPYGITSHAPKDAPVLVLSTNGNAELAVALVGWAAGRPKGLKEGEVALAHKDGNSVLLKENGDIVVTASGKVIVDAAGDIELGGGTLRKLMTDDIISKFNNHTHLCSGAPSTPGGPPTGSTPPTTYLPADATSKVNAE